jgi:hypothetical protein
MNAARLKDANLECNNKQGNTQTPTSSATMSGAISKDANLECYNEHGKTQKMPTLSATMRRARRKDANHEFNNEQGQGSKTSSECNNEQANLDRNMCNFFSNLSRMA